MMLGLQGKSVSAKPTTATREPFSKSGNGKSRPSSSGMSSATIPASGSRIRALSSSGGMIEKPEKLSRSSPYNSKMSTGTGATGLNSNRRVQSAATSRNKNSLGPTVKASELFRKNNSEPQLANANKRGPTSGNVRLEDNSRIKANKSIKHVRIDGFEQPSSLNSNLSIASNPIRFEYPHDRSGSGDVSSQRSTRRPFSFSSDRSRSVSVTSNDSCSTNEQESAITSATESPRPVWKQDYANNNASDNNTTPPNRAARFQHPRLNKRSYSMDTYATDSDAEHDTNPISRSPNFQAQMIEMKIAEHPDESLKEENRSHRRKDSLGSGRSASSGSGSRFKPDLNRTFSTESSPENKAAHEGNSRESVETVKSSQFDRLLLMHSDNILHDVSELINEIKSTETSKQQRATPKHDLNDAFLASKSSSVEKLVDKLRKDMKSGNNDSMLTSGPMDSQRQAQERLMLASTLAERFNMDLSGIELSDITCPQNVMEQSVPNSSRLDRPLSAAAEVLIGTNSNERFLLQSERGNANYIFTKSSDVIKRDEAGSESSDSNNQAFSSTSDALSTIQYINSGSSAGGGDALPVSPHSAFEIDQEEIQRKICSALKLLEDEDRKVRNRNASEELSARSQSPFLSISNPDSRAESRNCVLESCKSSPRMMVEKRNIPLFDERQPRERSRPEYISKEEQHYSGCKKGESEFPSGFRSARSCSCLNEKNSSESLNSARSTKTIGGIAGQSDRKGGGVSSSSDGSKGRHSRIPRPGSGNDEVCDTKDNKSKQIFSFLDEVEKTDQEMLFGLRFETDGLGRPKGTNNNQLGGVGGVTSVLKDAHKNTAAHFSGENQGRTMDGLIRKGSVELAREILLLERKLDEAQHAVKLLEESLLNQRELNIRNLRNSERDFKKRMKMQKDEFDMAFSRNEALISEMVTEKRALQEKLDKLIKNFEEMEEKHKEQIKSMQQKHLDEIRRLRKMQMNAENSLKQKLAGNKAQAQEIKEMTVKGLEPEVQRIIQRHQQEMTEMRAWHADEVREIEERYQRKLHMQLEDLREKSAKEKEDLVIRERELANRRLDAELKQKDDEIEALKRKHANDLFEERERAVSEEMRLKEQMQDSVRKAQIKGEVEIENLKQEYETKLTSLERRHESELKSVKDVCDAERQNWASNQMKRLEQALSEQESKLRDAYQAEKEKEWREKEKKIREDYEKHRKDDEITSEGRFKRMQEKFQSELEEMEKSEKDLKAKFSQAKSDLLTREEEVFSLKTSLSMKEKQLVDLQEMNMKMQEERVNLTSVIRREFVDQIQAIEEECRSLKATMIEIQSNSKLQSEQKQLEIEKIIAEKDAEIEKIGLRVKQALSRKDETILELQKQLEKCSFQINHLEELLEEQRKEVLHSMKVSGSGGGGGPRKK